MRERNRFVSHHRTRTIYKRQRIQGLPTRDVDANLYCRCFTITSGDISFYTSRQTTSSAILCRWTLSIIAVYQRCPVVIVCHISTSTCHWAAVEHVCVCCSGTRQLTRTRLFSRNRTVWKKYLPGWVLHDTFRETSGESSGSSLRRSVVFKTAG